MNGRDGAYGSPDSGSRTRSASGGTDQEPTAPGALRVALARTMGEPPPTIVVVPGEDGEVTIDGATESMVLTVLDPPRARLHTPAGAHDVLLVPLPDVRRGAAGVRRFEVVVDGWRFEVDVESEARARLRERATSAGADAGHGGPLELRAIIPGRVLSVDVAEGDAIEAGGRLLVIEAMKMQNELRAPRGGTIGRVAVGAGQTVELGDLLLVVD